MEQGDALTGNREAGSFVSWLGETELWVQESHMAHMSVTV
jgi:hypothetical protein